MSHSIEYFGDIALSSKSGSVYMTAALDGYGEPAGKGSSSPVIEDFSRAPWSPWGKNNLMPKEIAEDIENCGVLGAVLDAKARIGTGKGMEPFLRTHITPDGKEELEHVDDPEIQDWLELNEGFEFGYDSSFDKHAYGWNCGSYVLNLGRNKIYRIKRHDVYEARMAKKNSRGRIEDLYLSADWAASNGTYDTSKQVRLDLLEEGNELQDLYDRIASNSNKVEFAFMNRTLRNGRHYYPIPVYRSNKDWIKIYRSIPAFKIAMFKNSITLLQQVIIHPKFWEDKVGQVEWNNKYDAEKRQKFKDEYYQKIDSWLTGEDQAFKTLFTGGFMDATSGKFVPYIQIIPIDNKLKDGQYLPDSGAAISEIMFANMVNPSMMGAGNPAGKAYGDTSGGSNVRESFLVQLMITEAERRLNASVFNVVKHFNGWAKKLQIPRTIHPPAGSAAKSREVTPRLVFRYPSGLLTTLDTGKSTKSENL